MVSAVQKWDDYLAKVGITGGQESSLIAEMGGCVWV